MPFHFTRKSHVKTTKLLTFCLQRKPLNLLGKSSVYMIFIERKVNALRVSAFLAN
ncbi:MAG: hypothetical protein RIT03_2032 [Bacteroidota bacterium]